MLVNARRILKDISVTCFNSKGREHIFDQAKKKLKVWS